MMIMLSSFMFGEEIELIMLLKEEDEKCMCWVKNGYDDE
jgi:hypothetical protein